MAGWKDQLKDLYKNLQQDQKNKKGVQSKFDKVIGYKNKFGFNDTGIPLTPRAAKKLRKNKAAYKGRRTNYEGSTLQQINEERAADARSRWKHLKGSPARSRDDSPKSFYKRDYSVSEMRWRGSATRSTDRRDRWASKPTTFVGYGYDTLGHEDTPEPVEYIWDEPIKKDPGADYKPGKFPKVDEAIRALKDKKK